MSSSELTSYQLIAIGGGAAGFFAAINAAEMGAGPVLILERGKEVLSKVAISGGGRCNVTHDCLEPNELTKCYPRGEKSLRGPFHRFNASDTIAWFEERGVELKTEADGRMFPISDNSESIVNCLTDAASEAGVTLITREGVTSIEALGDQNDPFPFVVKTSQSNQYHAAKVLLASGGTRLAAGAKLASALGHSLVPNVPSLFTFKIDHPLLADLQGVSVKNARIQVNDTRLIAEGPILITHWGLSGPATLKLSAWGARELAALDYQFSISVNWLPHSKITDIFNELRQNWGKRQLNTRSPFPELSKRLWNRFLDLCSIPEHTTWAQVPRDMTDRLVAVLQHCEFTVSGKSLNKDEFVTAGGVELKEVNLKTFESKICPGLYFAGEVLNIDGITGGYNFQNAWTSGYLAAAHIATTAKSPIATDLT